MLLSRFRAASARELPGLLHELWHNLWQWLLGRSDSGEFSAILVLFLVGYIFLFWQWVSFLLGWQPRRSSTRLWAVSSIYMLLAMVAFAVSTWPSDQSTSGLPAEALGGWLFGTMAFFILAGTFLCATVSLWVISSRRARKLAKPPIPTPEIRMVRRKTAEQRPDLPRGGKDDEKYGAGCLVALGLAGLLPLLLVMWVITTNSLQSAWYALDLTSLPDFARSVWRWMRRDSPTTQIISLILIFVFGYCALLWQWIVFVRGRRTLLSPRWLWAVSSAYFIAAIAVIAGIYSTGGASREWLALTLVSCMIPTVFLTLTLPLWLLKIRPTHEPTKPQ
jgi:hypothetical protein